MLNIDFVIFGESFTERRKINITASMEIQNFNDIISIRLPLDISNSPNIKFRRLIKSI